MTVLEALTTWIATGGFVAIGVIALRWGSED